MPLLRNTGQPYFKNPNAPNRIDCEGEYCYPVSAGDPIDQQWYQTPCGNNELTDPEFENVTLGSELVSDNSFPDPSPSWVSSPGGAWTPTGGPNSIALYDSTFPGGTYTQSVVISAAVLYKLVITVGGLQVGDVLNVYLGSNTITQVIDTNGTAQVFYLYAGADNTDLVFEADSANNFDIDNVSLKEVTYGDWDTNGIWTLTGGTACKVLTGTGILEEAVADYIDAGDLYYLDFIVENYTSGSLLPKVANASAAFGDSTTVSANGFYRLYFLPTLTGVVSFTPSSDFVGCITALDLRKLRNDYTFELINPAGDSTDISLEASYYKDKVTMILDLQELEYDFGCPYQIFVYDTCLTEDNNLIANGTFASGLTDWQSSPPTQVAVVSSQAVVTFDPITGLANLCTNGDFSSGAGWTATGWTIAAGKATHNIGNVSPLSRSVNIGAIVSPPAYKVWWIQITLSGVSNGSVTIALSDGTLGTYSQDATFCWRVSPTIGGGAVTFSVTPTTDFDGDIDDIIIVEQTTSWQQGVNMYNTANPLMVAGNYSAEMEIISITTTGYAGAAVGIYGMATPYTFETTTGVKTKSIPNYVPGSQQGHLAVSFQDLDPAGGIRAYVGEVVIDNVELIRVEPFEATYESLCIDFRQSHPYTKLITAYSDQEAFGFEYANTGFRIVQRIECKSMNEYSDEETFIQRHGDGSSRLTYAAIELLWQFYTGLMDSSAHEALMVQRRSHHFIIGESAATGTEYIALPESYNPEWRSGGDYSLASAVLILRLKENGQIFNRSL